MNGLLKKSAVVAGLTLISRIMGMSRDIVIAVLFGASGASDAFFLAFRLPDLFRRLFGEGILTLSFVPAFARMRSREGYRAASAMAWSMLSLMVIIVPLISLLVFWTGPMLLDAIFSGLDARQMDLSRLLFGLMMPYIFIVIVLSIVSGALNVAGVFSAPAAAPLLFNLTVISSALVLSPLFQEPIIGVALGVTLGGLLQLLLQMPFIMSRGVLRTTDFVWCHPVATRCLKKMMPGVIAAGGYQINLLLGTFGAAFLVQGSVTCLYYADQLIQFVLGLFMISVATVMLPELSRQSTGDTGTKADRIFVDGVRLVYAGVLPAMAGLIVLRFHVIDLLFGNGAFDALAVTRTADCLLYLCGGIWACAGIRLTLGLYHAANQYAWPMIAALISTVIFILGAWFAAPQLGLAGIALAQSVAAVVNLVLLLVGVGDRIRFAAAQAGPFLIKTAGSALLMGLAVKCASSLIFDLDYDKVHQSAGVGACVLVGVIVYAACQWLVCRPEIRQMAANVRSRKQSRA